MSEEQKAHLRQKALARVEANRAADAAEPEVVTDILPEEPQPDPNALSEGELDRIRQEARAKIDGELTARREQERRALIAKTLDEEILRQRQEAGLTDYRDDLVEILIDVAPFASDLRIDGKVYEHGRWYTVPRRQHDSIREMMARSWDAEERAGNPNRKFRREVAGSMNPLRNEQRLPDGTLTVGFDPRVNGKTGVAQNLSVGV